jgi:hypothetical protein
MLTVVELPLFTKQTDELFTETEKLELISYLSWNPLVGVVIPGTNGVRKLRYASSGRGKRGGARVIYYYLNENIPLYALLAYPKNVKTDLSAAEKQMVSKLVQAIKATRSH